MWRSCRNETGFTLAQRIAWDFVLPYKHICILDSDTEAANKLAKYLEPFCKELEDLRKLKEDQMNKLPDIPPAEVQEDVKCLLAELTTLEEEAIDQHVAFMQEINDRVVKILINNEIKGPDKIAEIAKALFSLIHNPEFLHKYNIHSFSVETTFDNWINIFKCEEKDGIPELVMGFQIA